MIIRGRYELDFNKPPLGVGAMGVVYPAVDLNLDHCPVALKTVIDISNPTILELFDREWKSIAKIHHDNIVRIVDQGRFDDRGISRPFIVMEFLDGDTLDKLIRSASSRLTIENSLEFIYQVCRGLEKIHAVNLVHRDLKPGNIFITKDNRVKIIDFGLAHLVQGADGTSVKGTPLYMAPEQFEGKEPTALSDQFALGVVTYEMLTRQRPFSGANDHEIRQAILRETPLPASQINPDVSPLISCVIHKALAKKEQQRFASVRVFAEMLRKAQDGGPIEIFNPAGMRSRLDRARDYFKAGELDLASKTLGAIEADGYYDEEIKVLRGQIKLRERQRDISQRLETARAHMDAAEFPLALEEIEAALEIEPQNSEARTLQKTIESRSREIKVDKWHLLAEKHFEDQLYQKATEAVQQILKLQPNDQKALDLRVRIERAEREGASVRSQRRNYYEQAVASFQSGDVESAFSKMESLFRLGQPSRSKTPHDSDSAYENLFREIRNAQDELVRAYNDGRRNLAEKNYREAIRNCTTLLERYPGNAQLKALRVDAEDQEQRDLSAFIADVGQRVEAEPDLDKKVKILEEAVSRYPEEAHFQNKLKITRSRRDMVHSILDEKALLEKQGNLTGALSRLKAFQQIHPEFPGLEREMGRLEQRLREQREEERKAEWERQIQHELDVGDWQRAAELLGHAQEEFKDDAGLKSMAALVAKVKEGVEGAWQLLADGRALMNERNFEAGVETLRRAREAKVQDLHFLSALCSVYLEGAEQIYERDWKLAEQLIEEARQCDPANQNANDLKVALRERKRRDVVTLCLTQARELEANGRAEDALRVVEEGLADYPDEIRLQQLRERYFRVRPDLAPRSLSPDVHPPDPPAVRDQGETVQTEAPSWVLTVNGNAGDETAKREPPKPVEPSPDSTIAPVETWKNALIGRRKELIVGAAAFVLIALIILIAGRVRHAPPPPAPTASLTAIAVTDANSYKILDSSGGDVTGQATKGLGAGEYKLIASKPGFEAEEHFSIDPAKEPSKTLAPNWQALPAELTYKMTQTFGTLKVDDAEQALDGNSEFRSQWRTGSHSLSWQAPEGDSLRIPFEVKGDVIEMQKPEFRGGNFVGIVAVFSRGEVSYQAINAGGISKIVDGQSEALPAADKFSIGSGKTVSFKAKSGFPFGDFAIGERGQPLIYAYLATQHSGPPRVHHDPPPAPAPEPAPVQQTPPPPPTEDPNVVAAKKFCREKLHPDHPELCEKR